MSGMSNSEFEHIKHKISLCNNLTVLLKCFYYGDSRVSDCVQERFNIIGKKIDSFRDSQAIEKKLKSSQA